MRRLNPMILRLLALLLALAPGLAWGQAPTPSSFLPFVAGPTDIKVNSQPITAFFIGANAGKAYPTNTPGGYASLGIGDSALESLTATNAENTCVGAWSCQYMTTGALNTAFGMHVMGQDLTSNNNTLIGNDAGRDAIFNGGSVVGIGQSTFHDGNPAGGVVAIGTAALQGHATAVIIGGTKTTNDVLQVSIAASGTTPGTVSGLPLVVNYTVLAGDTLATIAANISTAINAVNPGIVGPGVFLQAGSTAIPDGTQAVYLNFPGTQAVGWALTTTVNNNGGTETMTVINGDTPSTTIAIGNFAGQGLAMQSPSNMVLIGQSAGRNVTTCSNAVMIGTQAGQNLTTCAAQGVTAGNTLVGSLAGSVATTASANTGIGYNALLALTTGIKNTVLGTSVGKLCTTCQTNTLIGFNVGGTTFTTGSGVILLGSGKVAVDTPASGTVNYLNIENIISTTGTDVPGTSVTTVAGSLVATGGAGAAGGFASSPRNIGTCGMGPNSATSAYTAQTPVATEFYVAEVFVPANVSVTGVAVFNSATISGNVKVGLANSAGVNVATSGSVAMAGTSAYQRVPFSGAYAAVGPATYYVEVFYDNATVRPNTITAGSCGVSKATAQVFSTGFTTIAAPTTFTTALGPAASLY